MDKKGLIAIIAVLAGGMLLGRYADIEKTAEKNTESTAREKSSPNYNTTAVYNSSSAESNSPAVSFADVVEKVRPSLVNISSVRFIEVRRSPFEFHFGDRFDDFFDQFFEMPDRRRREEPRKEPRQYRHEGTGSGFIVDSEGYVLTNYHVVKDAEEIKVTFDDGETYNAEVVGQDSRTDLAVVKIDASREFTPLPLGNSDNIRVGDWVVAAGSPFGLEQTFTSGIISAKRQDVEVQGQRFGEMIQTDASINRGNSGGPLVDIRGRAIGINTAIFAPTGVFAGVGFAIPVNKAVEILDQLIEVGRVVRGWLGIEIREVDEVVKKQFDLETEEGALVNRVYRNTPAQEGGIKRGDVITRVNGEKVKTTGDLQDMIASSSPGDAAVITVVRDGKREELEIELGQMPEKITDMEEMSEDEPEQETEAQWKGIHIRNIDSAAKQRYDLSTGEGVLVARIDPDAEAHGIGLRPGDIIRQINRKEVKNVEDFRQVTEEISLSDGVVFDILRNGRPVYLSYRQR